MSESREICISGASGFVGRHVVSHLESRNWHVRSLRRSSGPPPGHHHRRSWAIDFSNAGNLREALAGADTIVHLAGRAHVVREQAADPLAAFRAANVEITRQIAEAAVAVGVRRVIFASSVAVFGSVPGKVLDDTSPPAPDTPYGVSKLEAEHVLGQIAEETGLEVVCLRPPAVFGPGMRGNPLRLMELIRRGVPIPLGGVENRRSFIYVENLAAAIAAAIEMPLTSLRSFIVTDGTVLSTTELLLAMARSLERRPRLLTIPEVTLTLAGIVGDWVNRITSVPLSSYEVRRLLSSFEVNGAPFAHASGFQPVIEFDEGMRRTAAWLVKR